MSDQQTTDDPVIAMLREKRAALQAEIAARVERCNLLDELIAEFGDGRTRAAKALVQRRKGNSKPADTQPGGYDDGVSLDEAQGVLS
jgi:hypothetical protein